MKKILFLGLMVGSLGAYAQTEAVFPGDPAMLPNLKTWLRSDVVGALPDGRVLFWPDLSGHGNTPFQISTNSLPTVRSNAVNGLPVLRFGNGPTNGTLFDYSVMNLHKHTFVLVYRETQHVPNAGILSYRNHFDGFLDRPWDPAQAPNQLPNIGGANDDNGTNSVVLMQNRSTRSLVYRASGNINSTRYFESHFKVISAGHWDNLFFRVNGEKISESPADDGECYVNAFVLGARSGAGGTVFGYSRVEIAEIMVFDSAFTESQLSQLESGLMTKYGMVPAGDLKLTTARRLYNDHTQIVLKFNKSVQEAGATNVSNYFIDDSIQVASARLAGPNVVQLSISPGIDDDSYSIKIDGVLDEAGRPTLVANSIQRIGTAPEMPLEFGTRIPAFQDDFSSISRSSDWQVRGPGGDVYEQSYGILKVHSAQGEANHLVYVGPGGSNVTEVLAKIRINRWEGDSAKGGVAVRVNNSGRGLNLQFRRAGAETKIAVEQDGGSSQAASLNWTENSWYWMRLTHLSGPAPKMIGKIWRADSDAEEPAQGVELAYGSEQFGFAGFEASDSGALAEYEVDYVLLKGTGLSEVDVIPPSPRSLFLSIRRDASGPIVFWPKDDQLHLLQTNSSLDPQGWMNGPDPEEEGENWVVRLSGSQPAQFFRLVQ